MIADAFLLGHVAVPMAQLQTRLLMCERPSAFDRQTDIHLSSTCRMI